LYATKKNINLTSVERRKRKPEEKRRGQKEDKSKKMVKKTIVFLAALPIIAVECKIWG
jgi:hypothetical protein